MKRLLFFLLFFVFATPLPLAAQESSGFDRAFEDYTYQYKEYLENHKEYVIAKNQYQTYETLTTQTIALEQTAKMLSARDKVVRTYLLAIQAYMEKEADLNQPTLSALYLELGREAIWFEDHEKKLAGAATLADMTSVAKEAETRYTTTEKSIYTSFFQIYSYKEEQLHQKIALQIEAIDGLISRLRLEDKKDTGTIERWLLEAKKQKLLGEEKLASAQKFTLEKARDSKAKRALYNTHVQLLETSHQYLKEANLNLTEIITEIKRGDRT